MTFGAQKILWLLVGVIPVVWIMRFAWGRASARMRAFGAAGNLPRDAARAGTRRERLVTLAAMAAMVVGLAGPRGGFDEVEVQSTGADIFVALDLSHSMMAGDLRPTRFERARREVFDLLDHVAESGRADRVGLVGFAGVSFVQCPLTADTNAVREYLMMMSPGDMPVQGTDIGGAIMTALKAMDAGSVGPSVGSSVDPGIAATRAIVLISDGEDLEGAEASAVSEAKARGVRVFTVGVGTREGAPVPDGRGGFKQDRRGNVIVSKFGGEALREIAEDTGGEYIELGAGESGSAGGARNLDFVAVLGEAAHESGKVRFWHEKYQWPLAVAAGALAVLSASAAGRFASVLIVAGIAAMAWGGDGTAFAQEGGARGERERMRAYNEGIDAYERGAYDKSRELFGKAQEGPQGRGEVGARALYNSGNAAVAAGDLDGAEKAYEEALKITPDDKEAAGNLAWVREQKKQQQQQEQQQQDGKRGSGQNQQQDQQQGKQEEQSRDHVRDQDRQEQKGDQGAGKGQAKQQAEPRKGELSKEEAERVLNSVDDLKAKYLYFVLPKDQREKAENPPEKDW